jgi:16S rRNA (adenine1518-N6/adenine1519-N6)-dimethyltransferase
MAAEGVVVVLGFRCQAPSLQSLVRLHDRPAGGPELDHDRRPPLEDDDDAAVAVDHHPASALRRPDDTHDPRRDDTPGRDRSAGDHGRAAVDSTGMTDGAEPAGGLLRGSDVTRLLAESGLHAKRSLGQNFVVDPNTIRRIVRLAEIAPGDEVVEVGPGLGSLTLGLVAAGGRVIAIEKDAQLAEVLRTVVPSEVRIVTADALDVDLTEILGPGPMTMVANLPYNVATPLVLDVLDSVPAVVRMLVMVQHEVGERLAAPPGSAAYGIPSLRVAQHATAKVVGSVGPAVFHPRPRVRSALVALTRRERNLVDVADEELMWRLVRTSFGQRRKTMRRSLGSLATPADLEAAGIDTSERPERLPLEAFGRLSDVISSRQGENGR